MVKQREYCIIGEIGTDKYEVAERDAGKKNRYNTKRNPDIIYEIKMFAQIRRKCISDDCRIKNIFELETDYIQQTHKPSIYINPKYNNVIRCQFCNCNVYDCHIDIHQTRNIKCIERQNGDAIM